MGKEVLIKHVALWSMIVFIGINFASSATLTVQPITSPGISGSDVCEAKCTSCIQTGNKDCLSCEFGHFLLSVGGKVRCAQCPDYSNWVDIPPSITIDTVGDKNCLDCYTNPSTWQYTRKCTQKMTVIQQDTGKPQSFIFWDLKTPEIYKIVDPAGAGLPYTTEKQNGCAVQESSDFQAYEQAELWTYSTGEVNYSLSIEDTSAAKLKTITNDAPTCPADNYFTLLSGVLETRSPRTISSYSNCVQCLDGFVMQTTDYSCVPCPANCLECKLVANEKTVCTQCASSYFPDITYKCIKCDLYSGLQFCTDCYLRKSGDNQKIDQDTMTRIFDRASNQYQSWPSSSALIAMVLTLQGEAYSSYVMACSSCQNTYVDQTLSTDNKKVHFMYIPALDRASCVSCNSLTNCAKCDYFDNTNGKRRNDRALEGSDATNYKLRCTECVYSATEGRGPIMLAASGCQSATIANCEKYHTKVVAVDSMPELTTGNFNQYLYDSTNVASPPLKCKECQSGFKLAADALSCTAFSDPDCTKKNDAACIECQDDMVLNLSADTGPPAITANSCQGATSCVQQIEHCTKCYRFKPDPANANWLYRCTQCIDGFIPTLDGCKPCAIPGCSYCQERGSLYSFTNWLVYNKPQLKDSEMQKIYAAHSVTQNNYYCGQPKSNIQGNEMSGYSDYVLGKRYNCRTDTCHCNDKSQDVHCQLCQENRFTDFGTEFFQCISKDKLDCVTCPVYCQACSDRTPVDKFKINAYFEPDSDSLNAYGRVCNVGDRSRPGSNQPANSIVGWDSDFGRFVRCADSATQSNNSKLCQQQVKFWYVLTCGTSPITPQQKEQNYYSLIQSFPSSGSGQMTFSNDDFDITKYSDYNLNMYTSFEFYLYFETSGSSTQCTFKDHWKVTTGIAQNVFAIKDLKLIINTIDIAHLASSSPTYYTGADIYNNAITSTAIGKNIATLELNGMLNFQYFNHVEFNNLNIIYSPSLDTYQYGIVILKPLTKCDVVLNQFSNGASNQATPTDNYFIFHITNPSSLTITDSSIGFNTYPSSISPFNYVLDSYLVTQAFTLTINNLELKNLKITAATMLDSPYLKTTFNIDTLKITQCEFTNSQLFSDRFVNVTDKYPRADLTVTNLFVSGVKFTDSRLIFFRAAVDFRATKWTISDKSLFQSSSSTPLAIISSNTLTVGSVTVEKGTTFYKTTLFANVQDSPAILDQNTQFFKLDNIAISQIICLETTACILNLRTPTTGKAERMKTHINKLEITKVNLDLFQYSIPTTLTECEKNITLQDGGVVDNSTIIPQVAPGSKNTQLTAYYANLAEFRTKNVDTNLIYIHDMEEMLFTSLNMLSNVEIYGLLVQNVETLSIQNSMCNFEPDYSEQKFINVTRAQRCYSQLYSKDIQEVKRTKACFRFYEIQHKLIMKSVNISSQLLFNGPLFHLETNNFYTYPPVYTLCSVQLLGNIIFISTKESSTAGLIFKSKIPVSFYLSDVELMDSELITFQDIIAIVPSSTGIYTDAILSSISLIDVRIKNVTSQRNFNSFWIQARTILINGMNCSLQNSVIKSQYTKLITNVGGCGFIMVENKLTLENSSFIDSYSSLGGALYIGLISQALAFINSTQFLRCATTINLESISFGGAIYLDLSKSTIGSLAIEQSTFTDNYATEGGSIYIQGASTNFNSTLTNNIITNSNAISGGFLMGLFENKLRNLLFISKSNFSASESSVISYLSKIAELNDEDTYNQLSEFSLIQTATASLYTNTLLFKSVSYYRIIYNQLGIWIDSYSQIIDSTYYINSLITCFQSQVLLQNFTVQNVVQNQTGSTSSICSNVMNAGYINNPRCLLRQSTIPTTRNIDLEIGDNNITVVNSNFTEISCPICTQGILYVQVNKDAIKDANNLNPIYFDNNVFQNNLASVAAGIYFFQPIDTTTSSTSTRILQTTVTKTDLYEHVDQYILTRNMFVNNTALDMAGGVYTINQELTISQNTFIDNYSENNAGGLIIQNTYADMTYNSFTGNQAQAGAGLRLIAFQPRMQIDQTLLSYEEVVQTDTQLALANIKIATGNNFQDNESKFGAGDAISGCVLGEYYQNRACNKCLDGTYSINSKEQKPQCLKCPTGGKCLGSYLIIVSPNYWRPNIFNDKIEVCQNAKQNCIGQNLTNSTLLSLEDISKIQTGNQLCDRGYVGALCETCDIEDEYWNDNYASAGNFSCALCRQLTGPNTAIVVLISILTLGFIVFSVNSTLQANAERLQIRSQEFEASLFRYIAEKFFKTDQAALFIKIFTNYIQIISMVMTFDLSVPPGVNDTTQAAGTPIKKLIFSLDCFLIGIKGEIPIEYMRLLWSFVVPIIYMGLLLASFFFYVFVKQQNPDYNVIVCGILFLYLYYQPNLSLQFISVLSCRLVSGSHYIQAQMNQECYTPEHMTWLLALIMPTLLLLIFIIPLIILIRLRKSQSQLTQVNMRMRYGILYNEYNLESYYWELMKIIQKTLIILFVNFFNNDDTSKGTMIFVVLMVYAFMASNNKPYLSSSLNQLDLLSTYVCAISMIMAVLASANSSAKQPTEFSWMFYIAILIIGIINIYFIAAMITEIFQSQLEKMGEKAIPLKKQIVAQLQCCIGLIHVSNISHDETEARWVMIARLRRDWIQRRIINNKAVIWDTTQKLVYSEILEEVKKRNQEKRKKQEEEKQNQGNKQSETALNVIEEQKKEADKVMEQQVIDEFQNQVEFKQMDKDADNQSSSSQNDNPIRNNISVAKLNQVSPLVQTPNNSGKEGGTNLERPQMKSQKTNLLSQLEKDMDFDDDKKDKQIN